jgi:hypothetical protein
LKRKTKAERKFLKFKFITNRERLKKKAKIAREIFKMKISTNRKIEGFR